MTLSLAAFVQHVELNRQMKKPRAKAPAAVRQLTNVEVAMDDAKRRAVSGNWDNCRPSTFVGLHCMCHRMIYGITPLELEQPALFRAAGRLADKALRDFFEDDAYEFASFIRWSWEVEKRKAAWAHDVGHDRSRMSWKWQFGAQMVTDYRIKLNARRG